VPTDVLWFRRDLRLADHPALTAAAAEGDVVGLFVIDPALWDGAGPVRRAWLAASVRALQEATDGALVIKVGDPADVVADVARHVGAATVREAPWPEVSPRISRHEREWNEPPQAERGFRRCAAHVGRIRGIPRVREAP
jgi:deoxyribodipyrimidine photolyase